MRETIHALRSAATEIRFLRRSNELMAARLRGFDDALQLLNATPPTERGECAAIDAAYHAEREAEVLEKRLNAESQRLEED